MTLQLFIAFIRVSRYTSGLGGVSLRVAGPEPSVRKRALRDASPLAEVLAFLMAVAPMMTQAEQPAPPLLNLSIKELSEITVDSVFAASKFTQKVTDAPSSVSIRTRADIKSFGYRTLADIIRGVPGFDVTYDRAYSYMGVRGFNSLGDYGSRVLLLVDGHRMNDPIYDSAQVGTEALLDVDLIERVEFVRGPGSSIYGSNAFFGVISVVTRRGRDVNGVEASTSGGSYDTYSGRLTIGKQLDCGLEYLFSATMYASEGPDRLFYKEYDSPLTNRGIALHQDGDKYWSALGKVSYGDFSLQGGYVTRDKNVPTGSYGSVFNTSHPQMDSRGYVELRYTHEMVDGWSLNSRVTYDFYDYHEASILDRERIQDTAQARWWSAEIGASRKFFDCLHLSLGAELRQTNDLHQNEFVERPFRSDLNLKSSQMVVGTYLDSRWELCKSLSLSGGLRWDHYNTFGDTVNPRAALVWQPSEKTTLKLLFGDAFRAPNAYQLNYNALDQRANPDLQPETIRSYEIVAEEYFNNHWRGKVSLFRNEIKGLIDTVTEPGGFYKFDNNGNATVNGAEAEIEGSWKNGMLLRASYTRQQATGGQTGGWLVNSPEDMVKAQLSVPLFTDKLSASLEVLYASKRLTLAGNRTPDAWLLNLTLLSAKIVPNLEFSASIYNLLGREFSVPGGEEHLQDAIKQDGRTFRVKLTYRF